MWNNHKYVIWKPWAVFPSLYLEIRLWEVSERLWTPELWQSTKDRCQAVIPGNKWDYICRLFDSEWSLGKYELSLLVLSTACQPYNLFCCFFLAPLHTRGQAETIDCQIAVTKSQPLFTGKQLREKRLAARFFEICWRNTTSIWLAELFDLYCVQRSLLSTLFWRLSQNKLVKQVCAVSITFWLIH